MAKIDAANISKIRLAEQGSAPSSPAAGYGYLYEKSDKKVYFKDSDGTEHDLTSGGGGGSVEAWTAPSFENSWVNFGGSQQTAGYYKDRERVFLKGLIKSGTVGQAAFTLPSGYRPPADVILCAISNGSIARIDITAAGGVYITSGSNTWVSLDGLSFRV